MESLNNTASSFSKALTALNLEKILNSAEIVKQQKVNSFIYHTNLLNKNKTLFLSDNIQLISYFIAMDGRISELTFDFTINNNTYSLYLTRDHNEIWGSISYKEKINILIPEIISIEIVKKIEQSFFQLLTKNKLDIIIFVKNNILNETKDDLCELVNLNFDSILRI